MKVFETSLSRETWPYWGGLFIWMGLIFFFSHQPSLPNLDDNLLDLLFKKLAHAFAYAVLMGLWWGALKSIRAANWRTLLLAFIFTVLYAISDEWHQTFIPHRSGQLADVLVDSAGALLVFIFIRRQRDIKV